MACLLGIATCLAITLRKKIKTMHCSFTHQQLTVLLDFNFITINCSISHQQLFFSELPLPGWSHDTNYWYSWVRSIYYVVLLSSLLWLSGQAMCGSRNYQYPTQVALVKEGYLDKRQNLWKLKYEKNWNFQRDRKILAQTALFPRSVVCSPESLFYSVQ